MPGRSTVSVEAVLEAEVLAGLPLPPLRRRLYLEVGTGGFGPGYGLLGLRGGHPAGALTALSGLGGPDGGPDGVRRVLLRLCDWGCSIASYVDLVDGMMWGFDPNPGGPGVNALFPQQMTIVEWFARWAAGVLYQPWLTEDPVTGRWRGATEDEYREAMTDI